MGIQTMDDRLDFVGQLIQGAYDAMYPMDGSVTYEQAVGAWNSIDRLINVLKVPPNASVSYDTATETEIQELNQRRNILLPFIRKLEAQWNAQQKGQTLDSASGISKIKCKKCQNNNYKDLYDVADKEVMCKKCSGSGMYSDRSRIDSKAKYTPVNMHPKYGGVIQKYETDKVTKREMMKSDIEKYEKDLPSNFSKRGNQLTSKYIAYGKPNESLLSQTAYAIALATHKYDTYESLPPMLLANIYGGLTKFARQGQVNRYIDLDRLNTHEEIKDYIRNDAISLLHNISDL